MKSQENHPKKDTKKSQFDGFYSLSSDFLALARDRRYGTAMAIDGPPGPRNSMTIGEFTELSIWVFPPSYVVIIQRWIEKKTFLSEA